MSILEAFVGEVEDFLSETRMSPAALGKTALGDPSFVFDLRAGRSPHVGTIDKVREFMAAHREAA